LFPRRYIFDEEVYSQINPSSMKLRDYLATDRTKLGNQNTFLAYVRTALTLFVAGVTFIRFFESVVVETIGWIFIPVGLLTFTIGTIRYNRLRVALLHIQPPSRDDQTTTSG
jgi:putative membrane protein